MNSAYAFLAVQVGQRLLEAIWKDEYFVWLKEKMEGGLRGAADLTQFTGADDILVEDVIEALNDKEKQDKVIDILEDAVEETDFEKFVTPVTEFLREKLDIPDNDEDEG